MSSESDQRPLLIRHLPEEPTSDDLLMGFLAAVEEQGIEPYPAQEEAILELMTGNHVILNTPTGSGKSLVALAMHFKGLAEGKRSYYTCPIKALVSEKFFSLCRDFGEENVGMLTGDATINRDAPIICCTAEILSNMALTEGRYADVDMVIMDEFHYYSDPDRGVAWQLPLLRLPQATFLLMSATMGDNPRIYEGIEALTGNEVRIVRSTERPVPLDFRYSAKPIHETLHDLIGEGKTPIYVVNFTQRECAEMAQNLMSTNYCDKEHKKKIGVALKGVRFDSPYGKDIQRYLRHGVGLHHAGLLPRYRLLVEQLSQQGLLKIICGTDTLGVGVNVPIRTVVFSKLCKFDGQSTRVLSVRDFHQIAGRAGRKGYDTAGSVVCQAPEHVIENQRAAVKAESNPKKKRKLVKKKPPDKNYAHWDEKTFEKLQVSPPEALTSSFKVTHGMLINMLQGALSRDEDGWAQLMELIEASHSRPKAKETFLEEAETYLTSLAAAQIIELGEDDQGNRTISLDPNLQINFALHQATALFLIDTLPHVRDESEVYPLDVLTLVESILENPRVVLFKQLDKLKGERVAELKAEGMPYDERLEELDKVEYPKPLRDFLYITFNRFAETRPWVQSEAIRPKSVAREMVERFMTFADYIKEYGLQRSEGVLLRYLTQAYKTLSQTVPDEYKNDDLLDVEAYLKTMLAQVDSSLLREWEERLISRQTAPELALTCIERHPTDDPRALKARTRSELHQLLTQLGRKDYEAAALCIRQDPEDPWDAARFQEAMAPFYEEYEKLITTHQARQPTQTLFRETSRESWRAEQLLLDPADDNFWVIEAHVTFDDGYSESEPIIMVDSIHA